MGVGKRSIVVLVFLFPFAHPCHSFGLVADGNESDHPQKVYKAGPDINPPQLLPVDFAAVLRTDCKEVERGEVQLSLIVDDSGRPRNAVFVRALAGSLDRLALQVLSADRFLPGKRDGVPVAVAMLMSLRLEGCVVAEKSGSGTGSYRVHLKLAPAQTLSPARDVPRNLVLDGSTSPQKGSTSRIGGGVSAPVPILTPEANFPSDSSLRKTGVCLISLIVDANGLPQNPRVVRSLSPAMDQQALEAVDRYRFKPAMKNDQPVPVMMSIEVNFR